MSQIKIKQIEGLQAKLDLFDAHMASGSLKSSYNQANHGLEAGQVIAYFGGMWVTADASAADKLGRLVVESVTDADNFVAVQIGNIEVSTWNLTPGAFYVVDNTGNGTVVPFVNGNDPQFEFSNPVYQAITATKAQVLPWRPSISSQNLSLGVEHTQSDLIPLESNGNGSATGITMEFAPFGDSEVQVYINGVAVTESYGDKTGDVYFSNDGGATATTTSQIVAGTELFWNSDIAGFEIGAGDTFDLVYEKDNQI